MEEGWAETLGDLYGADDGTPVALGLRLGGVDGLEDTEGWADGWEVGIVERLGPIQG